jgi:hypothetical protein
VPLWLLVQRHGAQKLLPKYEIESLGIFAVQLLMLYDKSKFVIKKVLPDDSSGLLSVKSMLSDLFCFPETRRWIPLFIGLIFSACNFG